MPDTYNEHELIPLIATGDEQAFRQIFDHYRDKLYTYALRLTRNEELAEDIVLDAFLKIWINRADLTGIDRFDSYLYTIVRNRIFNSLKRLAHEADIIKELSRSNTEYHYDTEETVIYNDYKNLLHQAVNQLPPQQKQVYILSRNGGLKYNEIASELNLSKNTVKAHLRKATSTLRSIFVNYMMLIIILICNK
jgi:RNA polymerase sigma-70 factor (ECF subfamily)